ncbi:MAG TPA: sialidase family protein [Acidimicrobiales bacterium]|nr:sialidase family protein [Acidimicrobiales bacterium]
MRIRRRVVVGLASVGALAAATIPVIAGGSAQASLAFNLSKLNKIQQRLVSSELINALGPSSTASIGNDNGGGADGAPNTPPSGFSTAGLAGHPTNYFPTGAGSCSTNYGNNRKVNQNCLNVTDADLQGRGQANNETSIAEDALRPQYLVASNNDYRRGDGTCGASYSTDHGATWNDSTVPNGFTRGANFGNFARQYWQSGGDTSVAWDTKGNAYLSCQLFNRGTVASSNTDQSSAFAVFRSTGNNGASWNFPGRLVTSYYDRPGTAGVLEDKQLITVDNHVGSPFQDRVYVTWTLFAANGTGYIYEAYSSDYGQTFSQPVLVSGDSKALCTVTYNLDTPNGNCNENQFSQPFTAPDGTLYVVFDNYNNAAAAGTGTDNRNQVLLAKSTNGGASFSAPVKVSDYFDLPNCDTYQGTGADPGRACVPEKGPLTRSVFRATNYPTGVVNPTNNQVVVTFGSYINADSNEANGCVPAGFAADGNNLYSGVKTPGACNNKILISTSNNGGASFTGTATDPRSEPMVTQAPAQRGTDQWWQWAAITTNGQLAVSYYDRQYGSDETSGYMDVSISGSRDMVTFGQSRVTSSSMPPPTEFPGPKGGQFFGDYTGLATVNGIAYPIWSDTRSPDIFVCPGTATGPGNPPQLCTATEDNGLQANDEDIYTALVGIPIR